MAISGSFKNSAAVVQPMPSNPPIDTRHGQKKQPDNNWSAPPAGTGGGYPDAAAVEPSMRGRGLILDLGHRWGHSATAAIRNARRPFQAGREVGHRTDAPHIEEGAAQDAAAGAHGDTSAAYYTPHAYDPRPQGFAGEAYEVLPNNVRAIPTMSAQQIAHDRVGGRWLKAAGGGSDQFGPLDARLGIGGPDMPRWARARYSSPTLGAMYSRNTLRGILPQTVAVPVNQPALTGNAGQNSGIPSNTRFLLPTFTMPQMFRSPPSESEQLMATSQPQPAGDGGVMNVGF